MKSLDPLIVVSAAPRMGTTLVQRLLCSAPECLIYGDPVGNDAAFLLSYYSSKVMTLRGQAMHSEPLLAPVLAGDVSEFIAGLSPATEGYLESFAKAMAGPLVHCRDQARSAGRPTWGWKLAGVQPWLVQLLPTLLPQARIIQVERELGDTARSAKAAGMAGAGADFERFLAAAAAARSALDQLRSTGALPFLQLRLEELLADPDANIARLETFAGVSPIDRQVLGVKVNQSHSPWVPPVELSAAELAGVRHYEPLPHADCDRIA